MRNVLATGNCDSGSAGHISTCEKNRLEIEPKITCCLCNVAFDKHNEPSKLWNQLAISGVSSMAWFKKNTLTGLARTCG